MKRAKVPFDNKHFENLQKTGKHFTTKETFVEIYQSNHWRGKESVSGSGSANNQTKEISRQIPKLVKEFGMTKFLDIPCGDFNWLSKVDMGLEEYVGGDIIEEIINDNQKKFAKEKLKFLHIDLIHDSLPAADVLFCRDCLVHLSFKHIKEALVNLKRSHIRYLLTTSFSACQENIDIVTGDWRILNLEKAPFNFPKPIKLINEKCTEGDGSYADKCLGLWEIKDL